MAKYEESPPIASFLIGLHLPSAGAGSTGANVGSFCFKVAT